MSAPVVSRRQQIWDVFTGRKCPVCRSLKAPNTAFCRNCYRSLPNTLKNALWKRFGEGFEGAYESGLLWLQNQKPKAGSLSPASGSNGETAASGERV